MFEQIFKYFRRSHRPYIEPINRARPVALSNETACKVIALEIRKATV